MGAAGRGHSMSKGRAALKFTVCLGRECRPSEPGTQACGASEEESWDISLRAPCDRSGRVNISVVFYFSASLPFSPAEQTVDVQ